MPQLWAPFESWDLAQNEWFPAMSSLFEFVYALYIKITRPNPSFMQQNGSSGGVAQHQQSSLNSAPSPLNRDHRFIQFYFKWLQPFIFTMGSKHLRPLSYSMGGFKPHCICWWKGKMNYWLEAHTHLFFSKSFWDLSPYILTNILIYIHIDRQVDRQVDRGWRCIQRTFVKLPQGLNSSTYTQCWLLLYI